MTDIICWRTGAHFLTVDSVVVAVLLRLSPFLAFHQVGVKIWPPVSFARVSLNEFFSLYLVGIFGTLSLLTFDFVSSFGSSLLKVGRERERERKGLSCTIHPSCTRCMTARRELSKSGFQSLTEFTKEMRDSGMSNGTRQFHFKPFDFPV